MRSNKGFNLFTALIALMLLSITIVFVYNMVQTEENYLSLIETQSKTSDLLTIADLSRADAFNIFVVSFRERWAEHRSSRSNQVILERENVMLEWDDFVEYFANDIFFDRSFEDFFAQSVTQSLIYTNPPIGYAIDVPNYDRRRLSEIIGEAFRLSDEKIKVICEDNTNCLGSLYFKIDTRELSAQDYEELPRITVSRLRDDEVIQRPVFARREYRIYLPWRGFQAFRTVRNFSLSPSLEDKTNLEIRSGLVSSTGFLNPLIYNSFNSAKVGVCDIDSCDLRTDLFKTASRDGFQERCVNPPQTTISSTPINVLGTSISLSGNHNYDLRQTGNNDVRDIFQDLVETTLLNNINLRSTEIINSGGVSNLELDGSIGSQLNDIFIYEVSVTSRNTVTKQVLNVFVGGGSTSNIQSVTFNPSQHNQAANLGFNLGLDGNISFLEEESSIQAIQANNFLRCNKIERINLLFKFEETNPQYIVSPGNTSIYVELRERFPRYSFYHSSYPNPIQEGFFPTLNLLPINLTNKNWTCNSYEGTGAGQDPACIAE